MITPKKVIFIQALRAGVVGTAAAIAAGYSEATAAQAASRLLRDPEVLAAFDGDPPRGGGGRPPKEVVAKVPKAKKAKKAKSKAPTESKSAPRGAVINVTIPEVTPFDLGENDDSMVFLKKVMNHPQIDIRTRKEVAVALLPFQHKKLGEGGKKTERQGKAEEAGARPRYAPGRPPLTVVGKD